MTKQILELFAEIENKKKKVNINTEKFLEGSQKFGERLGFETNPTELDFL